jgi:HD-like signal output (HDOD) protein
MNSEVRQELKKRVQRLRSLPTSPVILQPLLELLRQPSDKIEFKRVVELVSYEKSIAAQCLRIANSPLFGRVNSTESIPAAVMSLGIRRIEDILLSCCLQQLIPADKWAIDPGVFWRHSLGCALASRDFADRIAYIDPDKAYLAGLLHDLGILVNSFAYAEQYPRVIEEAAKSGRPFDHVEQEILGFDHCTSGTILGESWQLPKALVEVIEWHHNIVGAPQKNPLIALVHLSDLVCRLNGLGYGYDEWHGIDFAASPAWAVLSKHCPRLATMDLVRFTLDLEGSFPRIQELVESVFAPKKRESEATQSKA